MGRDRVGWMGEGMGLGRTEKENAKKSGETAGKGGPWR